MKEAEPNQGLVPGKKEILETRELISFYAHITPVLTCRSINALSGSKLFFKCENFQKAGAFKFRGAVNAVMRLSKKEASNGVATHSSGNHAQALSLASKLRGITARIVMPENASLVKVAAVESYGGIIRFCRPTLEDRETTLKEVIKESAAREIHPYNDYRIIAGQATAAAEFLEQISGLESIVVPVGGGGLLSGTILSARYFSSTVRIYGAEPEMANDAQESFRQKRFIPVKDPATVADGLRTSLGSLTFPIISGGAEDILTASEEGIILAMKIIWERMKVIVEPSAAVGLAVILENPDTFRGKRTGVILSGGNTDLSHLPWQIS